MWVYVKLSSCFIPIDDYIAVFFYLGVEQIQNKVRVKCERKNICLSNTLITTGWNPLSVWMVFLVASVGGAPVFPRKKANDHRYIEEDVLTCECTL